MKETVAKTKVIVRRLPPNLKAEALVEVIDKSFAGRYNWFSFHEGKTNQKRIVYSRAYLNFKKPEDVLEFYESFEDHAFVNERGLPFKACVEYAPFQAIPKAKARKDAREGTIFKDPDYLAFVEEVGKPSDALPSAEVQLERREAERARELAATGGVSPVIVTPLMEYVRGKRAAKAAPQQKPLSAVARQAAARAAAAAAASAAASTGGPGGSSQKPRTVILQEKAKMGEGTGMEKRSAAKDGGGTAVFAVVSPAASASPSPCASSPSKAEPLRSSREREAVVERKRREALDSRDRRLVREAVVAALSSVGGAVGSSRSALGTSGVPGTAVGGKIGASTLAAGASGGTSGVPSTSVSASTTGNKSVDNEGMMSTTAIAAAGGGGGGGGGGGVGTIVRESSAIGGGRKEILRRQRGLPPPSIHQMAPEERDKATEGESASGEREKDERRDAVSGEVAACGGGGVGDATTVGAVPPVGIATSTSRGGAGSGTSSNPRQRPPLPPGPSRVGTGQDPVGQAAAGSPAHQRQQHGHGSQGQQSASPRVAQVVQSQAQQQHMGGGYVAVGSAGGGGTAMGTRGPQRRGGEGIRVRDVQQVSASQNASSSSSSVSLSSTSRQLVGGVSSNQLGRNIHRPSPLGSSSSSSGGQGVMSAGSSSSSGAASSPARSPSSSQAVSGRGAGTPSNIQASGSSLRGATRDGNPPQYNGGASGYPNSSGTVGAASKSGGPAAVSTGVPATATVAGGGGRTLDEGGGASKSSWAAGGGGLQDSPANAAASVAAAPSLGMTGGGGHVASMTTTSAHGTVTDKPSEVRRVRNKDRPDRPVWTPRRRPETPQSAQTAVTTGGTAGGGGAASSPHVAPTTSSSAHSSSTTISQERSSGGSLFASGSGSISVTPVTSVTAGGYLSTQRAVPSHAIRTAMDAPSRSGGYHHNHGHGGKQSISRSELEEEGQHTNNPLSSSIGGPSESIPKPLRRTSGSPSARLGEAKQVWVAVQR